MDGSECDDHIHRIRICFVANRDGYSGIRNYHAEYVCNQSPDLDIAGCAVSMVRGRECQMDRIVETTRNEDGCCHTEDCCDKPDIHPVKHNCGDDDCAHDERWCFECLNCGCWCNCGV